MAGVRVAVAQVPVTADPRANGDVVRRVVRSAAGAGARLVLLPEGMLSGYAVEQHADWSGVDWALVRDELTSVAALAGELGVWVVLGSAHPLTPPHLPHNSLYVISDEGRVVDRYDKRWTSHTETTRFYTPGTAPTVFEVDGFRFGCLTCIEVSFPELFAEYETLGVDCLLLPAYPVDSVLEVKARAQAATCCYWVALSVPAQSAELMASEVVGPHGLVLGAVSVEAGEELVVVDLDCDDPAVEVALTKARPWRAAVRAGYHQPALVQGDPRSDDRTCT